MKLHNLLETMPRTAFVHIEDNYGCVLYISLEVDNND